MSQHRGPRAWFAREELAFRAGIHKQTVSRLENRVDVRNRGTLALVAEAFGYTVRELETAVPGEDNPEPETSKRAETMRRLATKDP